jgi:hypothetical protein
LSGVFQERGLETHEIGECFPLAGDVLSTPVRATDQFFALTGQSFALIGQSFALIGQSFALKGQYIPARRIAAGAIAPKINALKGQ